MEKINLKTPDLVKKNIEAINAAFPNVITEVCDEQGKVQKVVNFELLKQELSTVLVEGDKERYQLTWPGKRQAILQANAPISQTLRPVREDSVDWDTTQNLYIEGDNLEVLKLLQESYLNKIKCIYIDPPYNTGKDFIYKDDFRKDTTEYLQDSGQVDDEGNRLFQNNESNGRFHSDWLTMMFPRLKLARNLLKEDGVIFISIDDNEAHNLRKLCDEVFGEQNFVACVVWQHSIQPKGYLGTFSVHHNFILVYSKSSEFILGALKRTDQDNKAYSNPDNDPKGFWRSGDVRNALYRPNLIYDIISPTGKVIKPPSNGWRWSRETLNEKIRTKEIIFNKDETGIVRKIYLNTVEGRTPETIWFGKDVGTTRDGNKELKELFDNAVPFDTPKPVNLINKILDLLPPTIDSDDNEIILDYFSGSATTAHSVMHSNANNGSNRKYIMVQIPEIISEDAEANKASYSNICEIGKERIRRAAKKIKEETGAAIDYGFRAFRVDSTNMKDVYYSPQELNQAMILDLESNIKDDRTGEDLLIQVMLSFGLPLSLPMETKKILGRPVYFVAENSLVACFAEEVQQDLVRAIAKEQPLRVVFRDSSFTSDAARINVEEIFKALSPSTEIKVL